MTGISKTVFRRNTSLGKKFNEVSLLHPVKDASLTGCRLLGLINLFSRVTKS